MEKITQVEQIAEAINELGGKGTISDILSVLDTSQWKTETPYNTVTSLLSKFKNKKFEKDGEYWTNQKPEIYLNCSDGVLAAAIAKKSKGEWTLYGISDVHGFGNADYEKVLFDTTFDDIIPYNSMSGVSYVAVKNDDLWGLIRFRLNPKYAFNEKFFEKAIGTEPIDESVMDLIGHEIKLLEDTKHHDINNLIDKYHLENLEVPFDDTDENEKTKEEKTPTETWSEETCRHTQEALQNLDFGWNPITNQVMMKKRDGAFGHIEMNDALNHNYRIIREDGEEEYFPSVYDLTKGGWALD